LWPVATLLKYVFILHDDDIYASRMAVMAATSCPMRKKKLLTGMDSPYDIKVVFVHRITFVLRKINENCCHQGCTF